MTGTSLSGRHLCPCLPGEFHSESTASVEPSKYKKTNERGSKVLSDLNGTQGVRITEAPLHHACGPERLKVGLY